MGTLGQSVAQRMDITPTIADQAPDAYVPGFSDSTNGYYIIKDIPMGANITVYAPGYTYDPLTPSIPATATLIDSKGGTAVANIASRNRTNLLQNTTHSDFSYYLSPPPTCVVSGTVWARTADGILDHVLGDISINYQIDTTAPSTVITQSDGSYSITIPYGSTITLSATDPNHVADEYILSTTERSFTGVTADIPNVDFYYDPKPEEYVTVSGQLKFYDYYEQPITGAELTAILKSLPGNEIQYSKDGGYTWDSVDVNLNRSTGTYTITGFPVGVTVRIKVLAITDYTMISTNPLLVTNLQADVTGQDFCFQSTIKPPDPTKAVKLSGVLKFIDMDGNPIPMPNIGAGVLVGFEITHKNADGTYSIINTSNVTHVAGVYTSISNTFVIKQEDTQILTGDAATVSTPDIPGYKIIGSAKWTNSSLTGDVNNIEFLYQATNGPVYSVQGTLYTLENRSDYLDENGKPLVVNFSYTLPEEPVSIS